MEDSNNNEFKNLILAYEEKVKSEFMFQLFLLERNLAGEFSEWANEKTLQFNIFGSQSNS